MLLRRPLGADPVVPRAPEGRHAGQRHGQVLLPLPPLSPAVLEPHLEENSRWLSIHKKSIVYKMKSHDLGRLNLTIIS